MLKQAERFAKCGMGFASGAVQGYREGSCSYNQHVLHAGCIKTEVSLGIVYL